MKNGTANRGFVHFLGSRVAPPRFLAFLLALTLATAGFAAGGMPLPRAYILGFDIAALLFLLLAAPLLRVRDVRDLRRHAAAGGYILHCRFSTRRRVTFDCTKGWALMRSMA